MPRRSGGSADGPDRQLERLACQGLGFLEPALPRQRRGELVHLVGDAGMFGPGGRLADRQGAAKDRLRFGVAAAAEQSSEAVHPMQQPEARSPNWRVISSRPPRYSCSARSTSCSMSADVIGQVNHRVAGRVVLGAKRCLRDGERVAAGGDRLAQPSLPPQVGRQPLQQRHPPFGCARHAGQHAGRLPIQPLLLHARREPPSSYKASAMSGWSGGSELRRNSSASLTSGRARS